jgi:hypothetical protein
LRSQKRTRRVISIVAAVCGLTALMAAPASATIVPAKFSSAWTKESTTGLTVKKNGLEAKTCTLPSWSEGFTSGSQFGFISEGEQIKLLCPNTSSSVNMVWAGSATYDTVTGKYNLHFNDYTAMMLPSLWGYYTQQSGSGGFNATWTNGSGATASTFTFANQTFGSVGGQKLTIDGTVKATTSSGGLLTLSH